MVDKMANKGPIYKEEDVVGDPQLLRQLYIAVAELEEKMKAAVPIKNGLNRVGWGVNKAQRGIAADAVISIARAIKALKGW
jgi:hypothetical protein